MKYDFDKVINRRETNSLKWDVKENELPMWVADMDFQTAAEIIAALQARVNHGVFGYSDVSNDWYEAIIGWWQRRHHFQFEKDWLIFCTGVVPAISSIVRKMTTVGENVLIQSPVYNIFYNSIINNGRRILESPLNYRDGVYEIDFEELESKLADPQTTLMILCNPHNPIGKIWTRETLQKIGDLCAKHHVLVISDEIHCDLTDPGCEYIPFASVSEACKQNSITCVAPTKAFNLAGLQTSAVIVPNEIIRHKVNRGLNTDEVAEPNAFAIPATVAAFTSGDKWLDELRAYISENKRIVAQFIQDYLPQIKLVPSQATYLLWLDCHQLPGDSQTIVDFTRKTTGLYLSDGKQYGKGGDHFLRMNIACSREVLMDGLNRLQQGISEYEKNN